jgi:hypothetical protein
MKKIYVAIFALIWFFLPAMINGAYILNDAWSSYTPPFTIGLGNVLFDGGLVLVTLPLAAIVLPFTHTIPVLSYYVLTVATFCVWFLNKRRKIATPLRQTSVTVS